MTYLASNGGQLKGLRADATQMGMMSDSVIKDFDVVEHICFGQVRGGYRSVSVRVPSSGC